MFQVNQQESNLRNCLYPFVFFPLVDGHLGLLLIAPHIMQLYATNVQHEGRQINVRDTGTDTYMKTYMGQGNSKKVGTSTWWGTRQYICICVYTFLLIRYIQLY